MDGDLLLLIFAYIQPSLWREKWFMNYVKSELLSYSVKMKVVSVTSACIWCWRVPKIVSVWRAMDFLLLLMEIFLPGCFAEKYCRFHSKSFLLFQKSSSLTAACMNAKTLSYWSEDLAVPNPSKTSYGRYATVSSLWPDAWLLLSLLVMLPLRLCLGYDSCTLVFSTSSFSKSALASNQALKISFSFRPCLLWGADLGRRVPLLHDALSRSFSMEEAPSWGNQDSTWLGKTCWDNSDNEAAFQTDTSSTKNFIVNIFSWYPTKSHLQ